MADAAGPSRQGAGVPGGVHLQQAGAAGAVVAEAETVKRRWCPRFRRRRRVARQAWCKWHSRRRHGTAGRNAGHNPNQVRRRQAGRFPGGRAV